MKPVAHLDIILVTHDGEADTVRCLESIAKAEWSGRKRVILVDNASKAAIVGRITKLCDALGLEVLHEQLNTNEGWVGGVNRGMMLSKLNGNAPYVLFLNNDTELSEQTLVHLRHACDRKSVSIAGPLTNATAQFQYAGKFHRDATLKGDTEEIARELWRLGGTGIHETPMVAFFCTMLTRACLDAVGELDPDFGVGLGDDDDYCHRARELGHGVVVATGAYCLHGHRSTFWRLYSQEQIVAMQKVAMRKFKDKHGLA